jgi:hypothetical protein
VVEVPAPSPAQPSPPPGYRPARHISSTNARHKIQMGHISKKGRFLPRILVHPPSTKCLICGESRGKGLGTVLYRLGGCIRSWGGTVNK